MLDYQDGRARGRETNRPNPVLFLLYMCACAVLALDATRPDELLDLVTSKDPWVQVKFAEALLWCACAIGLLALATYHWWVNNRSGYRIANVAMFIVFYVTLATLEEAHTGVGWRPWYRPGHKILLLLAILLMYRGPLAAPLRRAFSDRPRPPADTRS
jgi:hypothetical protein